MQSVMANVMKYSRKLKTKVDGVQLRLHRKSIEQKTSRARTVEERRGVNLEDLVEEFPQIEPPFVSTEQEKRDKKAEDRRELLQRWKTEKALKRKLEKDKMTRPIFKVCKVVDRQPVFLPSIKKLKATQSTASNKPVRGVKRALVAPSLKGVRAGPMGILEDEPSRCTRAGASSKLAGANAEPCTSKAKRASFAPPLFEFSAPSGVESFAVEVEKDSAAHSANWVMGSSDPLQIICPARLNAPKVELNIDDLNGPEVSDAMPSVTKHKPLQGTAVDQSGAVLAVSTDCDIPTSSNSEAQNLKAPTANHQSLELSPLLMNNPRITISRGSYRKTLKSQHPAANYGSEEVLVVKELDDIPLSAGESLTPGHFRNLMTTNTQNLELLCGTWLRLMENQENITDNVIGRIRTTIGQSELLMSERFEQFSSLIDDCEFSRGEKPTSCRDLQGFWEMIYIQVEDVLKKFAALEDIKNKAWAESESPVKKQTLRKPKMTSLSQKRPVAAKNEVKTPRSQAARQRLAEAKAALALRQQQANGAQSAEVGGSNSGCGNVQGGTDQNPCSREGEWAVVEDKVSKTQNEESASGRDAAIKEVSPGTLPRRSLRQCSSRTSTSKAAVPSSPLLLPFLEVLSISPKRGKESTRLSELYSPLRSGRTRASVLREIPENAGLESSPLISFDEMEVKSPKKKPRLSRQLLVQLSPKIDRSMNLFDKLRSSEANSSSEAAANPNVP